jgi:hypothetical protein
MTIDARKRGDRKIARRLRVFFNGVDVTSRCFYADGRRGVVRLYKLNPFGQKYADHARGGTRRIATEELRGKVRWGRKVAA